MQIAKSFGAEVTGVCSTGKVDMVSSLGADHVIDYTKEDFSQNGLQYDLIHAANGYHSISQHKGALKPNGTYIMTGGSLSQLFQAILLGPWFSLVSGKKMGNMLVSPNQDDLTFMSNLIDEGKVTPRIDRRFTLSEVPTQSDILKKATQRVRSLSTCESCDRFRSYPVYESCLREPPVTT